MNLRIHSNWYKISGFFLMGALKFGISFLFLFFFDIFFLIWQRTRSKFCSFFLSQNKKTSVLKMSQSLLSRWEVIMRISVKCIQNIICLDVWLVCLFFLLFLCMLHLWKTSSCWTERLQNLKFQLNRICLERERDGV